MRSDDVCLVVALSVKVLLWCDLLLLLLHQLQLHIYTVANGTKARAWCTAAVVLLMLLLMLKLLLRRST